MAQVRSVEEALNSDIVGSGLALPSKNMML